MPLAYCPVCQQLRTIRKAPVRFPGQREAWAMAEHNGEAIDAAGNTARCPGVGKHV